MSRINMKTCLSTEGAKYDLGTLYITEIRKEKGKNAIQKPYPRTLSVQEKDIYFHCIMFVGNQDILRDR